MARGAAAKQAKKAEKAEKRKNEAEMSYEDVVNGGKKEEYTGEVIDMFGSGGGEKEEEFKEHDFGFNGGVKSSSCCGGGDVDEKISKGRKKRQEEKESEGGYFGEIKLLPLIFLALLCGGPVLTGMFYAADHLKPMLGKMKIGNNLGYRLGLGSTPQLRVISFYEKHAPEKVNEVNSIMSKYYGEYDAMIKKLERKYHDYGYFIGWEKDAAPSTLAWKKIDETYTWVNKEFRKHAPRPVRTAVSNAYYNGQYVIKRGRKIWKKYLAPHLGVPTAAEAEAQKRKDRKEGGSRKKKKKGGKHAYRDEEEM